MSGRRRGRGWGRPTARWLAPEVVQSSAMDCGPAALKCLLEGFGRRVSYERLRELCRTDLDGTSIDTLERLAVELGLAAEQVMLPVDHLLVAEARAFPALLVVVSPIGATHFVVVWNRRGGWLQIMDPAFGRRWVPAAELLSRAYVHGLRVPAPAWREWAASAEFLAVARARMRSLGIGSAAAERLLAPALAEAGWRRLGALDAALRMASSLHRAAAMRGGRDAAQLLAACCRRDQEAPDGTAIPLRYWSVRPAGGAGDELLLRGAVLVRVLGLEPPEAAAAEARQAAGGGPAAERAAGSGPEAERAAGLRKRLLPARTGPVRSLFRMLAADGRLSLPLLLAALAVAAAAAVLEAMLLRGLLDVAAKLGRQDQRAAAAFALLALFAIQLGLEVALVSQILSAGRRLEVRLRLRLLETIAGLSDRYFRSRLVSDLAERCHSAHRLRSLPEVASNFLRNVFQLVLTAGAMAWLDPAVAPLAALAAGLGLLLPIAAQPLLTERDMKVRSHVGALARVHLDGLLGLVPARNHGAERCLRREHEGLLVEWVRSALRLERAALDLDLLQSIAGYGLAVWLVLRHLGAAHHDLSQVLLLGYWALQLPQLAQQADLAARQYPLLRSTALRVMEPLRIEEDRRPDGDEGIAAAAAGTAAADEEEPVAASGGGRRGVGIRFERVAVTAAGHDILRLRSTPRPRPACAAGPPGSIRRSSSGIGSSTATSSSVRPCRARASPRSSIRRSCARCSRRYPAVCRPPSGKAARWCPVERASGCASGARWCGGRRASPSSTSPSAASTGRPGASSWIARAPGGAAPPCSASRTILLRR